MATTTYGDISQRTAAWAATKMLEHQEPIILLGRFGDNKPVPKNKAQAVKFRRPIPFTISTTPLTEGVVPTAQQMQYEDVSATLAQYGAVVEITDVVQDLSEDPVLSSASELCGEQAGETCELVTWGVVKAGTNVFYANGTARTDLNTALTLNKQRAVIRGIKSNRGKKHTKMLGGSPNDNTTPIEAAFLAFGHTDLESDIRNLAGFTPVAEYGQRQPLPMEIGSVEDVRYMTSPVLNPFLAAGSSTLNSMTSAGGVNTDVYPIIYCAKNAYAHVSPQGKESMIPQILNPNVPRGGDPLGQKGTVGWKKYYVALILNQGWMARLEVCATDL